MKRPFGYSVAFQVRHPTLAASVIAAQLERTPTACWTVGEPRRTPRGTPLEGVRKESYCSFDVGSGDDGELAKCLRAGLRDLHAREAALLDLRATGGTLSFYVFWYPDGDTGEVFDIDLLLTMASLGIELGINVFDDRLASEHGWASDRLVQQADTSTK